jgi:predicted negative regulator of RcsB-dependent stress response
MSMTPHSDSSPSSGDDRNLVSIDASYIAPTFEDRLRLFWEQNSRTVLISCAIVLVGIVAKGGYEILSAQREKGIAADYAIATSDAQLKAFAASHADHMLGGLAELRLADQAYAAGNYGDARGSYVKAAGALKNTTFGQRARLAGAICAVQAGSAAEGEAALKLITTDLAVAKIVRAEAAYHLATLAVASGNSAEAIRFIEQVASIDMEGQWAERATLLRSALPPSVAVSPAADAKVDGVPSISFK